MNKNNFFYTRKNNWDIGWANFTKKIYNNTYDYDIYYFLFGELKILCIFVVWKR